MERESKLHKPKFERVILLCNLVGGECGASPTLVFLPVFILIAKENTKTSATIFLLIIISLFNYQNVAHYMIETQK